MQCNSFCPITFSTAPTCWVCSFWGKGGCSKKAAVSATNADNGKAGNGFNPHFSASNISDNNGGFKHE